MTLVLDAILFANKKHKGQVRKVSGDPYISHPIAVSYLVASYKQSKKLDELLAATILHDTLEDTDTNFIELTKKFTPLVASLVLELSNDPVQIAKVGKLEYQKKKMLGMSSYGLIIKLADRLHNLSDHPSVKMKQDTLELLAYLRQHRKLSKTHNAIIVDIIDLCKV